MEPGQHIVAISASPEDAVVMRSQGWHVRDTVIILMGPTVLYAALLRWPLREKTIAAQVLRTGTGVLNIDACRVSAEGGRPLRVLEAKETTNNTYKGRMDGGSLAGGSKAVGTTFMGRWPTNLLLIHDSGCSEDLCCHECPIARLDAQTGVSTSVIRASGSSTGKFAGPTYASNEASRTMQSLGGGYEDSGGASRFYPQFRSLLEASEWLSLLVS